jgi:hypothetical protein
MKRDISFGLHLGKSKLWTAVHTFNIGELTDDEAVEPSAVEVSYARQFPTEPSEFKMQMHP